MATQHGQPSTAATSEQSGTPTRTRGVLLWTPPTPPRLHSSRERTRVPTQTQPHPHHTPPRPPCPRPRAARPGHLHLIRKTATPTRHRRPDLQAPRTLRDPANLAP